LRALAEFGIPWLIGCFALGSISWLSLALGMCYTIAYFGLIYQAHRFRWLGSGQLAAAALLTGLRLPFAAAWIVLFLIVQFGLHVWTDYARGAAPYVTGVQPLVLAGLLLATITIAF
jgi:hypothetical protein